MDILESNLKTALEHWAAKFILIASLRFEYRLTLTSSAIYFGKDSCKENCYCTRIRNTSDCDNYVLSMLGIYIIWEKAIFPKSASLNTDIIT